jgi:isocitrate dehydrogenase
MLDFLAKEFPKEYRKIRFGSESAVRTWQAQLEAIGAPNRELGLEVGLASRRSAGSGPSASCTAPIEYADCGEAARA